MHFFSTAAALRNPKENAILVLSKGEGGKDAMRYREAREAELIRRLNRFAALVLFEGREETVHVKNTGRLGELLYPGSRVYLTPAAGEGRRTRFDLIAACDREGKLYNVDSLAPNRAMKEYLEKQGYDRVIPEYRYGGSRLDFYMTKNREEHLTEVKGCTLIREGEGVFPDAPTARGTKHLLELAEAKKAGYRASVSFVIQTEGVFSVRPNSETDPSFAGAWQKASEAGVEFFFYPTRVTPEELTVLPPRKGSGRENEESL